MHLGGSSGNRPIAHHINFARVRGNPIARDHIAQVAYLLLRKEAFAQLGLQTLILKSPHHHLQSLQVLFHRGREHNNVARYNNKDLHCWSTKIRCINRWKVLGTSQSPKGILFHQNKPKGVQKAVLAYLPQ